MLAQPGSVWGVSPSYILYIWWDFLFNACHIISDLVDAHNISLIEKEEWDVFDSAWAFPALGCLSRSFMSVSYSVRCSSPPLLEDPLDADDGMEIKALPALSGGFLVDPRILPTQSCDSSADYPSIVEEDKMVSNVACSFQNSHGPHSSQGTQLEGMFQNVIQYESSFSSLSVSSFFEISVAFGFILPFRIRNLEDFKKIRG